MEIKKINTKIHDTADIEKGSIAWKLLRLGKITSNNLGTIIPYGKKQNDLFSEFGKAYLYEVASEKNLREEYTTEIGAEKYFETKSNEYCSQMEEKARELYSIIMGKKGFSIQNLCVTECLDEFAGFVDIADGCVLEKGDKVGVFDVKCPNGATFMKYKNMFEQGLSLKEIEPKCYWQCLGHIFANNVKWCDFVFFNVMQKNGFIVKRINPYESEAGMFDIELLKERIQTGIVFIDRIVNNGI